MIEIRQITALPTLMHWRAEALREVFGHAPSPRLLVASRQYYRRHIGDGSHKAFVARLDGDDAGCGSVCFTDELPSPDNPTGRCAYLMSIYVRKHFRGNGIAGAIVGRLVDEARAEGCCKIYLESTAMGEPVYRSLGFAGMPDMMKYYDPDL